MTMLISIKWERETAHAAIQQCVDNATDVNVRRALRAVESIIPAVQKMKAKRDGRHPFMRALFKDVQGKSRAHANNSVPDRSTADESQRPDFISHTQRSEMVSSVCCVVYVNETLKNKSKYMLINFFFVFLLSGQASDTPMRKVEYLTH